MADEQILIEARLKDFISSNLSQLETNLKAFSSKAVQAAKPMDSAFQQAGQSFKNFVTQFGPAALVTGALAATFNSLRRSIQIGSELQDLSDKIGLSTDFLQKFGYVSSLVGVNIQHLAVGFKTLSVQAYAASTGSKESQETFARLGVKVTDSNMALKSQSRLSSEVIDALAGIKNATERTALAQKVFGRGGIELLPIINQGSDAIRKQMEAAEKYGLVLSGETIKSLDDTGDSIETLSKSLQNLSAVFVAEVSSGSGLTQWIDLLAKGVGKLKGIFEGSLQNDIDKLLNQRLKLETQEKPWWDPFFDIKKAADIQMINEQLDDLYTRREKLKIQSKTTGPAGAMAELSTTKVTKESGDWERGYGTGVQVPTGKAAVSVGAGFGMGENRLTPFEMQARRDYIAQAKMVVDNGKFIDSLYEAGSRFELDKTLMEKTGSEIRVDNAQNEMLAKLGFAKQINSSLASASRNLTATMIKDAKTRRAVDAGITFVEGTTASVIAFKEAFSSSGGEFYAKLAQAIAVAASTIALTTASVASINSKSFAAGTKSSPEGPSLVGESGAELITGPKFGYLPVGSRVFNARETSSLGGGGSSVVNLNLSIPSNAVITKTDTDRIVDKMEALGSLLVEADRHGYLNNFKMRLAA